MANTWLNSDGLYLKFGPTKATATKGGEYRFDGPEHIVELDLTLADVTSATAGATILNDVTQLPAGAFITEVKVVTKTAGTGTNAALNVGLVKSDRSTEVDFDGLIAALPLTSVDAAGETTTLTAGSTYGGALIGTALAYTGLFCADYDTAIFTAGRIYIRVKYVMPTA